MGYINFSMSERAAAAKEEGMKTASELAVQLRRRFPRRFRGVTAASVAATVPAAEWHHTSKFYNSTNFYNPADVFKVREKLRAKILRERGESRKRTSFENCTVTWLEWSGSWNRPSCIERSASGVEVLVKGKTAYFMVDGEKITKRLTTHGFSFRTVEQYGG